ncbi:62b89b3d-fb0e-472e-9647-c6d9a07cb016 [Sclerotinia trifoliorum]|uniref:62b89b3d-fb0e-472e-9647-c6d9a07cb016 n=1 Tax=Sclerotinia trifoliorum TaxID=28548 RepID=A0A8H2VP20_9HELO|nr:62b89b3d-fb0e-472e-9647-c6d9a07cb016 [Sclerotinia trifoliorum]
MEFSTGIALGHSTSSLVVTILASYVAYLIVGGIIQSHRRRVKAKKLQCLDPPALKNRLPFGIDHVNRSLNALATNSFPVHCQNNHKELNALTYSTSILGKKGFSTIDEDNIKAVLGTQFQDFDLGAERRDNLRPFLGFGIFAQDGKHWEHSRGLLRPQFARDNLSDLEMEERHFQVLLQALPKIGQDGWSSEVDIQPLLFRFTLDAASDFLLGQSVNSQLLGMGTAPDDTVEDFGKEFDTANKAVAQRARFNPYSWLIWPKGFAKAISVCHRAIDRIVAEHLKEIKNPQKVKNSDRYVFFKSLAEQTQDPIELRTQVLNILLAGRDTTSSLIGFTLLSLARDPERYKKLREVIVNEFGTFNDPKNITFMNIKSCAYLQWVLKESLRVYPVVPLNLRIANKDTTLPRGGGKDGKSKIFVRKGEGVEYHPYALHRREDIWGKDAAEFKPERWEGKKVGWEFLPFNGGPRICLGQQYALTEAGVFMIRMLQKFDQIESVDKDKVTFKMTGTMCSGNGVKIRLHEAKA